MKEAAREMKAGNAAGLDECAVECLKFGGTSMTEWLVRQGLAAGAVSIDWGKWIDVNARISGV